MRVIHKHVISAHEPVRQTIRTSFAARVLHVQAQGLDPYSLSIWLDLDDESPWRDRAFEFITTGGSPPEGAEYISTHLFEGGQFVLHLYEVQP